MYKAYELTIPTASKGVSREAAAFPQSHYLEIPGQDKLPALALHSQLDQT